MESRKFSKQCNHNEGSGTNTEREYASKNKKSDNIFTAMQKRLMNGRPIPELNIFQLQSQGRDYG